MTRIHSRLGIALLALAVGLVSEPLLARGPQQEAVTRYKQGRALIEKKQYEEALRELTASYELLESPNTLLLMAHAERELGHKSKAAKLYEQVIQGADARVAEGEERFAKTAADAKEWLDKLSKELGKISITVSGAVEGTKVLIDGEPVEASRSDGTLRVEPVWWNAGSVRVEAIAPDGTKRSVRAEVPAGGPAAVTLDLGPVTSAREPTEPLASDLSLDTSQPSGKPVPTGSWITGGIGVAGLATFAIFGSMAKSKASDLDACSPRCPESERDVADAGKRDQAIANVGLAVGGMGLAAAAGFYLFQSDSDEPADVNVSVAPGGVLVRGTFR